jgi:hypothetical protein
VKDAVFAPSRAERSRVFEPLAFSRMRFAALCLTTVAVLAACGGGSEPDPAASSPAPAPGPASSPAPAPSPAMSGWQNNRQIGLTNSSFGTEIYATAAALDDNDRGWVAWAESGECSARLWVARLEAGTWGAAQHLPHVAAGSGVVADVVGFDVAANANGDAALVWSQRQWGSACNAIVGIDIWVRRYVGGAWLPPERVSTANGGNSTFYASGATVAIDDAGRVTVGWVQHSNDAMSSPYARRYEGGAWQPQQRLNAGDRYVAELALGQAGNGDVLFAWRQDTHLYDPGQSGGGPRQSAIWSARFIASNGTWAPAARVGSVLPTFGYEERPRLAVGAGGHAVLAWERLGDNERSIYGARFDPSTSTWSAAVELDGQAGNTSFPSVAINGTGQAQIAWLVTDRASNRDDGYTARWNAGAGPQAAVLFENNDLGNAGPPSMGIAGDGRAVLAWPHVGEVFWSLRARHVLAGGMEDEVVLQSGSGGARPTVVVNARGQAIVAQPRQWATSTSFNVAAYAALYLP